MSRFGDFIGRLRGAAGGGNKIYVQGTYLSYQRRGWRNVPRPPEHGELGFFRAGGNAPVPHRDTHAHTVYDPPIKTWGDAGGQHYEDADLTTEEWRRFRTPIGREDGGRVPYLENPRHWANQTPRVVDEDTYFHRGRLWRGLRGAESTVPPDDPAAGPPGFWRGLLERHETPYDPRQDRWEQERSAGRTPWPGEDDR